MMHDCYYSVLPPELLLQHEVLPLWLEFLHMLRSPLWLRLRLERYMRMVHDMKDETRVRDARQSND